MKYLHVLTSVLSTFAGVYYGIYFLEIATTSFQNEQFSLYIIMTNVQSFLFLLDLGFGQHAARLIAKNNLLFNDETYLHGLRYKYDIISRRLFVILLIIDVSLLIYFGISYNDYSSFFGLILMSSYLYLQVRYSFQVQFLYAKKLHFSSKLILITIKTLPILTLVIITRRIEPNFIYTSGAMVFGVFISRILGHYLVKYTGVELGVKEKIFHNKEVKIFLENVQKGSPKVSLFNFTNFILYRGPIILLGLALPAEGEKHFIVLFSLVFFMFGLSQTIYYLWYPGYLSKHKANFKLLDFTKQYFLSLLFLSMGSYFVFLLSQSDLLNLAILKSIDNGYTYCMVISFFAIEMFWQIYSGYRFALDDFGFAKRFLKSFLYSLSIFILLIVTKSFDLRINLILLIIILNFLRLYYEMRSSSQWKKRRL
jgi:hypothetical protein